MVFCCNHHGQHEEVVQINVYGATLTGMLNKGINIPHILRAFGYDDSIVFDVPRRDNRQNTRISSSLDESLLNQMTHGLLSPRREVKMESSLATAERPRPSLPHRELSGNMLLNCSLSTIASCGSSVFGDEEEHAVQAAMLEEEDEFMQEQIEPEPKGIFRRTAVPKTVKRFVEMSDSRLYTDDISFSSSVADCVLALLDDVCCEADSSLVKQKSPVKGSRAEEQRMQEEGENKEKEDVMDQEIGEKEGENVVEEQDVLNSVLNSEERQPLGTISTLQSIPPRVEDFFRANSDAVGESAHEDVTVKNSESSKAVVSEEVPRQLGKDDVSTVERGDAAPEDIPPQLEETVYYDENQEANGPSAVEILSKCLQNIETGELFPQDEVGDVEALDNIAFDRFEVDLVDPLSVADGVYEEVYEEPFVFHYEETSQIAMKEDQDMQMEDNLEKTYKEDGGDQQALPEEKDNIEDKGQSQYENMLMRDATETASGFTEEELERGKESIDSEEHLPVPVDAISFIEPKNGANEPLNRSSDSRKHRGDQLLNQTQNAENVNDVDTQIKEKEFSGDRSSLQEISQENSSLLLVKEKANIIINQEQSVDLTEMSDLERNPLSCDDPDEFFDCSQGGHEDEHHNDVPKNDIVENYDSGADDFGGYEAYDSFLEPDPVSNDVMVSATGNKADLSRKSTGEDRREDQDDAQKKRKVECCASGVLSGEGEIHVSFLKPDRNDVIVPIPKKKARLSKNAGGDRGKDQNGEKKEKMKEHKANSAASGGDETFESAQSPDLKDDDLSPVPRKTPRVSLKDIEGKTFSCRSMNCNKKITWKQMYGRNRFQDHVRLHYSRPTLKCAYCDYRAGYDSKMRYHNKKQHPTLQFAKPTDVATAADREAINKLWDICFPEIPLSRLSSTSLALS